MNYPKFFSWYNAIDDSYSYAKIIDDETAVVVDMSSSDPEQIDFFSISFEHLSGLPIPDSCRSVDPQVFTSVYGMIRERLDQYVDC